MIIQNMVFVVFAIIVLALFVRLWRALNAIDATIKRTAIFEASPQNVADESGRVNTCMHRDIHLLLHMIGNYSLNSDDDADELDRIRRDHGLRVAAFEGNDR